MSLELKPVQVRLPPDAHRALAFFAKKHNLTLGGAGAEVLTDVLLGRARGESIETPQEDTNGYVYVIRVGNLYKIGKARDIAVRISGMSLPEKPEIISTIKTTDRHAAEKNMHRQFAEYRRHGEWFELSQEAVAQLREA